MLVGKVYSLSTRAGVQPDPAAFVPLVAVAAAYFAREGVRLPWRWALLAAGLAGIHSSLSLAYLNQHLGHVLSLAVMPVAVTSASRCRRDTASAAFAGFVASAALLAYWPTVPLIAIPIVLVAGAQAWRRSLAPRKVAVFAAAGVAVVLLASPVVVVDSLRAVVKARRTAVRNDPALLAFNPYLTEELLPLAAGLARPGAFTDWRLVEGPRPVPAAYDRMAELPPAHARSMVLVIAGHERCFGPGPPCWAGGHRWRRWARRLRVRRVAGEPGCTLRSSSPVVRARIVCGRLRAGRAQDGWSSRP